MLDRERLALVEGCRAEQRRVWAERVVVRHGDPAARARHEELGFFDGWGSVTGQLTAFVEGAPVR